MTTHVQRYFAFFAGCADEADAASYALSLSCQPLPLFLPVFYISSSSPPMLQKRHALTELGSRACNAMHTQSRSFSFFLVVGGGGCWRCVFFFPAALGTPAHMYAPNLGTGRSRFANPNTRPPPPQNAMGGAFLARSAVCDGGTKAEGPRASPLHSPPS